MGDKQSTADCVHGYMRQIASMKRRVLGIFAIKSTSSSYPPKRRFFVAMTGLSFCFDTKLCAWECAKDRPDKTIKNFYETSS